MVSGKGKDNNITIVYLLHFPFHFPEFFDKILATKCDGNRNIFHLAVTMCEPTGGKNHTAEPNNFESTSKNNGLLF